MTTNERRFVLDANVLVSALLFSQNRQPEFRLADLPLSRPVKLLVIDFPSMWSAKLTLLGPALDMRSRSLQKVAAR
jgi:hypothetical protein